MGTTTKIGNDSSVALAMSVLLEKARQNPKLVQAIFEQAKQDNPNGMKALFKAVGIEAGGSTSATATEQALDKIYEIAHYAASVGGVYLGTIGLTGNDGRDLGVSRDIFAIRQNLREITGDLYTFNNTAKQVAKLDVDGHTGCDFDPAKYRKELIQGLTDGTALGKLFIPTLEMLNGKNNRGQTVCPDNNLYSLRNEGDLAGTLPTKASGADDGHWLWSCTPDRVFPGYVRDVDFTDGNDGWAHRGLLRLGCRPCFALAL